MASVLLRTAGSAVGNALLPGIGGAFLGAVGSGIGGMVDGQLGLGKQVTGPRLDNLSVQDSRYGAGIATLYGRARVAGNVIWSTDLIEAQHNSDVGGKGGGTSVSETTYTYSVHAAIGICAGPIIGLTTVWADNTVIYQDGVWSSGVCDSASFYTGAAGQAPDSFMQSILGAGSVPSYQGLAYIVFDNLQLAAFGNRLPNLTFEINASSGSSAPVWLGSVDAGISQRIQGVQSGSMPPISLQIDNAVTDTVLIGGYSASGSSVTFAVESYDVSQGAPVQIARANSASFTAGSPVDCAWALSPDGRFIALYLQNSSAPTHSFVLYDTLLQSFGAILTPNVAASSTIKQIAWLDAQHVVIDDAAGGIRGLHVLARAGVGLIDLGFTAVWGSGSAASTILLLGAQFTPYADGLIAYVFVGAGNSLQARFVNWRRNALSVGAAYTVAAGLALGSGSGAHAQFVPTAAGEWTLCYGNVVDYRLLSFAPSATSASVTRAWQIFTPSFGTGTTYYPLFYGDRLVIVQRPAAQNTYCLSEVTLGVSGFSLTLDAAPVSGGGLVTYFAALRLDSERLLFMGMGGFVYDIGQVGIIQRACDGSVAAILADILNRAGYAAGDYDVSALNENLIQGYALQDPMSARHALEPLQAYAPFDLIETAGQLKAVLRGGGAAATVPSGEWRAAPAGKQQPPPVLVTRAQEMDLPREVVVEAIDPARNYEVNSQRARRIASSARTLQQVALPIVMNADSAKQIAERLLYTAWAERDLIKLSLSRAWAALDPADVIDLGTGNLLRIASINQSGGQSGGWVQVEGFYSYPPSLSSNAAADGGQSLSASGSLNAPATLYLLDLPLLHATDDQPGFYAAASNLSGWKGAGLLRSSDGVSYTSIGQLPLAATAGIAATALAGASALYMDNINSVTVQLLQGGLSSCSFIDLTTGANAALVGNEICQFQTATLVGPGLYTLTNLLRGRRGTEGAITTHAIGENFILLQAGAVDFFADKLSDRNQAYEFRAVAGGQTIGSAADYSFTYGMQSICPFAPVNIKGTRAAGITGDLTLTWTRRARLNAEWVDYIDVPLDEPQELYEVDILNGATVLRAFTGLTTPTVIYTAAQQTTDWVGSIPASFTVNIYQVSSRYGNGKAATAVV